MKNLFYTLLGVLIFSGLAWAEEQKMPVRSKEDVTFFSKNEHKMIALLKTEEFNGVIHRHYEKNKNLQSADLYVFKNVSNISMDHELCKKLLERIYGPLDKISLHVRPIELYPSHSGKICEAQIDNEDSLTKIPERRTLIGFIRAKPFGLVFKFSKKSTSEEQAEVRKFWDSLR